MPLLTRRNIEVATKWSPTIMAYGTSAWLGLLYFTDWKAVVRYIPFYGSKFEE